jgi:hypothetical protein
MGVAADPGQHSYVDVKLHSEDSLRTASDAFVTFLYAAAVHLIIAHFAWPGPMTTHMSFGVLFVIIVIFSDWLSRVRLPWQLPRSDVMGIGNQLAKTVLEVGGLYFLVLACLSTIASHGSHSGATGPYATGFWNAVISAEKPFAFFLFLTFFWNLFMLKVMRQLSWRALAAVGLNGRALDLENADVYAKRFWQLREKLEHSVETNWGVGADKTLSNLWIALRPTSLEALARTGSQIVALHVAWASLCVGAILIADMNFGQPLYGAVADQSNSLGTAGHILLAALIVAIVFLLTLVFEGNQSNKTRVIHTLVACAIIVIAVGSRRWLAGVPDSIYAWIRVPSDITRVVGWLIGLFVIPTFLFWAAALTSKGGAVRQHLLWLGGTIIAVVLLLLYMSREPTWLMIIVAFEQVLVNAFLQYAASERLITVTLTPAHFVMSVGETTKFSAIVTGTSEREVRWGVTGGSINNDGDYAAPIAPGTYKVCATSQADRTRFAEATVTVHNQVAPPGRAAGDRVNPT